jgi:hypothetical protein
VNAHAGSAAHLSDDALTAFAALGEADEAARQHLTSCTECAGRLDALVTLLAEVRSAAADEADDVFGVERLDRQRDHILRRIEHTGRPARVIEFPHRAGRTGRPMQPIAVRWVAAAAAAGLVIGVFAGRFTGLPQGPSDSRAAHISSTVPPTPQSPVRDAKLAAGADEEILSEVETALMSQSAPELRALDALTPRIRDIAVKIR